MEKYNCTYETEHHCQYNIHAAAKGNHDCDEDCDYLEVVEATESAAPSGQAELALLCDMRFKIGIEINWQNPAENIEETVRREEMENMIQFEAAKLAGRLTNKLLKKIT